jgi:hypothetical protein
MPTSVLVAFATRYGSTQEVRCLRAGRWPDSGAAESLRTARRYGRLPHCHHGSIAESRDNCVILLPEGMRRAPRRAEPPRA